MPIALPYRFDTSSVWHTILKGAFGLNAVMLFGILLKLVTGDWLTAVGLALVELVVAGFTRLFIRFQTGSAGTLYADHVEIDPNVLLGIQLPGPAGTYNVDRFSKIRVEYFSGPIDPGVQGGPNELVSLVGTPGTPDIVLARTSDRAGRAVAQEFATLLHLPMEELHPPKTITI